MQVQIINTAGQVLHEDTIECARNQWVVVDVCSTVDATHYDVRKASKPEIREIKRTRGKHRRP